MQYFVVTPKMPALKTLSKVSVKNALSKMLCRKSFLKMPLSKSLKNWRGQYYLLVTWKCQYYLIWTLKKFEFLGSNSLKTSVGLHELWKSVYSLVVTLWRCQYYFIWTFKKFDFAVLVVISRKFEFDIYSEKVSMF